MKRLALVSGVVVLTAAWIGPLPAMASGSFAAHMILHVSVVAVAAPLIAIGLTPCRLPGGLLAPLPASIIEFVVVWVWHTPLFHEAARLSFSALLAEQGSFAAAGLLLWLSALGGGPGRRAAGVGALLLTSMHMVLLGTLLTLAPRPLYDHPEGHAALLVDQQAGGMIMLLAGALPYLAGGLYLVWRLIADPNHEPRALPAAGKRP